jgi:hypothetical protein
MAMKVTSHFAGVLLVSGVLGLGWSQAANAVCTAIAVTADEGNKAAAVARSQAGLQNAINEWAKTNKVKNVRVSPLPAKPDPYWRSAVTADLFLKPDVRTAKAYTVCWRGVISPAVCTSGA